MNVGAIRPGDRGTTTIDHVKLVGTGHGGTAFGDNRTPTASRPGPALKTSCSATTRCPAEPKISHRLLRDAS